MNNKLEETNIHGVHEIPLNTEIAQFLAQTMRNLIKNNSLSMVVSEVSTTMGEYLYTEFTSHNVIFDNKNEILRYLSEKFEIITTVLEITKKTRETFPNAILTLKYDDGSDPEGEENSIPSLVLYVHDDSMDKEKRIQIRSISEQYEEILARYDALFYTEPYLN